MFAQTTFNIDLRAPSFINDSLIFSPPSVRKGLEDVYNFKVHPNKSISSFGAKYGFAASVFEVKIKEHNVIEGQFDYPQPVSFQYYDRKAEKAYLTSTFFLDSGNFKITLPAAFDSFEIDVQSPVNIEYASFKKLISGETDVNKKEAVIGTYIKAHPESYVALWEIVNDYSRYFYQPVYLKNLQLFSTTIKETKLFKVLESRLTVEAATVAGKAFPAITFDKQNSLTKEAFKNHPFTFIDYWSTTCLPCIKAMPELVAMHHAYKDKGVQFITITDEQDGKKMATAQDILRKNKVVWKNYFDTNKDFQAQLNATGYPHYFLIDSNGIIVARMMGDLPQVRSIIDETLKKP